MRKVAFNIASYIKKNTDHPSSIAVLQYAIEGILNTIVTTLFLFGTAFLTGRFTEVFLITVSFSVLRLLTGGAHLRSSWGCTFFSTSLLLGTSFIPVSLPLAIIFCLSALYLVKKYKYYLEPYQSKKPLKNQSKFQIYAYIWIMVGLFLSLFPLLQHFSVGLMLQALTITPNGIRIIHELNRLLGKEVTQNEK